MLVLYLLPTLYNKYLIGNAYIIIDDMRKANWLPIVKNNINITVLKNATETAVNGLIGIDSRGDSYILRHELLLLIFSRVFLATILNHFGPLSSSPTRPGLLSFLLGWHKWCTSFNRYKIFIVSINIIVIIILPVN